jgi:ubiquinone/menaquinone biosynthesis C-methylase UbiE
MGSHPQPFPEEDMTTATPTATPVTTLSTAPGATTPTASNAPAPDLAALKAKQQAAWGSGDYAVIGTTLQLVGEQLAEACDLRCDERVLDVAAGNGNATLAAARRGARVTSTDYVAALLDRGAERARAERLDVSFQTADVEALPFADASFDAVLSTFGVMFAPDHARAAAEMARVCRPGGRIGLANWTPEGFIGQLFKVLGRHLPPPAGVQPPSRWGVEAHLQGLFGATARTVEVTPRLFQFRYRSPAHFIEVFRTWYGPVHKAFAALPAEQARALEVDMTELLSRLNRAGKDALVVPSEYLEVVVTRA